MSRSQDERISYPKYRTTLVTRDNGTIVGRGDQHPAEVVGAHYGHSAGLHPWQRDGIEYLVVEAGYGERPVLQPGTDKIMSLTSERKVLDYVFSLTQERIS